MAVLAHISGLMCGISAERGHGDHVSTPLTASSKSKASGTAINKAIIDWGEQNSELKMPKMFH